MQAKAAIEQLVAYEPNDMSQTSAEWFARFETMLLTMNFEDNRVLLHFDLITMPEGATLPTVAPMSEPICE